MDGKKRKNKTARATNLVSRSLLLALSKEDKKDLITSKNSRKAAFLQFQNPPSTLRGDAFERFQRAIRPGASEQSENDGECVPAQTPSFFDGGF
ncbi:MAG: hypothetical protein WC291_10860 [Thermodesulfovibrionales bacterium]